MDKQYKKTICDSMQLLCNGAMIRDRIRIIDCCLYPICN